MVVVDNEPQGWFLLRDDSGYVLDVNCSQSFVSFSVVLRLTSEEAAEIDAHGHKATDELARAVQYSPSTYSNRYGDLKLEAASHAAIRRWQVNRSAA